VTEAVFDDLIHAPQRLRICAIASAATSVEFGELLSRLGISKSALSKHVSQLVQAGYLEESHITRAGSARLSLSLTTAGRAAYRGHLRALDNITRSAAHVTGPDS